MNNNGASGAALAGTGIVSVMRRRRTALGPFLRPDAAHNATLCLGPLWAPFEADLVFGERVRRTRSPSGATSCYLR
jgi:hypothetical protein